MSSLNPRVARGRQLLLGSRGKVPTGRSAMKLGANRRSGSASTRPARVRWLYGRVQGVARFRDAEAVALLGPLREQT